jgi:hypothetical protein
MTIKAYQKLNSGASGGLRSRDLRLTRPLLYQAELPRRPAFSFACAIIGISRTKIKMLTGTGLFAVLLQTLCGSFMNVKTFMME